MQKPKKGTAKKPVTKTTVVKPTADSTAIYQQRLDNFVNKTGGNLPVKLRNNSDERTVFKMASDVQRQSKKGKPGYDKNGFPIKKSKKGGSIKSKRK